MPDEHSPAPIDMSQPVATRHDLSRLVATGDEYISIKDVRQIFLDHNRKVTERMLQRYCEKQHVDGKKMLTAEGEKWFVLKSSVLTRIKELDEFDKLRPVATSDDMSAPVADETRSDDAHDSELQATTDSAVSAPVAEAAASATISDETRPVATSRDTYDKNDA